MVNIPELFSEIKITLDPEQPFRSLQERGKIDRPRLSDPQLRSNVEAYVNRTLWHLIEEGTGTEWTGEGKTPANWAGPVKAQYTLKENILTVKLTSKRVAAMQNEPYGPIPGRSIEDTVIRTQVANKRNMLLAWLDALQSGGHVVEFKKDMQQYLDILAEHFSPEEIEDMIQLTKRQLLAEVWAMDASDVENPSLIPSTRNLRSWTEHNLEAPDTKLKELAINLAGKLDAIPELGNGIYKVLMFKASTAGI